LIAVPADVAVFGSSYFTLQPTKEEHNHVVTKHTDLLLVLVLLLVPQDADNEAARLEPLVAMQQALVQADRRKLEVMAKDSAALQQRSDRSRAQHMEEREHLEHKHRELLVGVRRGSRAQGVGSKTSLSIQQNFAMRVVPDACWDRARLQDKSAGLCPDEGPS
jgi:hypothetical protein